MSSDRKSETQAYPGSVGYYVVWPHQNRSIGSNDWSVNRAVLVLMGMAIPTSVTLVECFLFFALVIVMFSMVMFSMVVLVMGLR